jgi:HEAT repeat protein
LQAPEPLVRRYAAVALAGTNRDEALEALLRVTRDSDKDVRLAIMESLASFGVRAKLALPALEDFLSERDPTIRARLLRCLVDIGVNNWPTIPALFRAMHEKEVADVAFERPGQEGPAGALILLMALRDESIRLKAVQTMGRMGADAQEVVPALTELATAKNDGIRKAAADALRDIASAKRLRPEASSSGTPAEDERSPASKQ